MVLKKEEIISSLKGWSNWKKVYVKSREKYKMVRDAQPTPKFWRLWNNNKTEMKVLGFNVHKSEEKWIVSEWEDVEEFNKEELDPIRIDQNRSTSVQRF